MWVIRSSRAPWCCWRCTADTCASCGLSDTCRNRNGWSWRHRMRARLQKPLKTEDTVNNNLTGHWSCHTGGTACAPGDPPAFMTLEGFIVFLWSSMRSYVVILNDRCQIYCHECLCMSYFCRVPTPVNKCFLLKITHDISVLLLTTTKITTIDCFHLNKAEIKHIRWKLRWISQLKASINWSNTLS